MHLDELREEQQSALLNPFQLNYFISQAFQAGRFEGRTIAGSKEDSSRIKCRSLSGSQQPWWEKIPFNNHEECSVRIIDLFLLGAVYLQCPLKLGSGSWRASGAVWDVFLQECQVYT